MLTSKITMGRVVPGMDAKERWQGVSDLQVQAQENSVIAAWQGQGCGAGRNDRTEVDLGLLLAGRGGRKETKRN